MLNDFIRRNNKSRIRGTRSLNKWKKKKRWMMRWEVPAAVQVCLWLFTLSYSSLFYSSDMIGVGRLDRVCRIGPKTTKYLLGSRDRDQDELLIAFDLLIALWLELPPASTHRSYRMWNCVITKCNICTQKWDQDQIVIIVSHGHSSNSSP